MASSSHLKRITPPRLFGGTIPVVGDMIVIPDDRPGPIRQNPSNRVIAEVVRRYFLPGTDATNFVGLVVACRSAIHFEMNMMRG